MEKDNRFSVSTINTLADLVDRDHKEIYMEEEFPLLLNP
jgi:hypothetical protein